MRNTRVYSLPQHAVNGVFARTSLAQHNLEGIVPTSHSAGRCEAMAAYFLHLWIPVRGKDIQMINFCLASLRYPKLFTQIALIFLLLIYLSA
jgi:hypothetical protein